MRIAIGTVNCAAVNGAAIWAYTIAKTLKRLGHEAFILTFERGFLSMKLWGEAPVFIPPEYKDIPKPVDLAIFHHPLYFINVKVNKVVSMYVGMTIFDYPVFGPPSFAISDEVRAFLASLGLDAKVLYCPVDLERCRPGPPLRDKPRVLLCSSRRLPPILRDACVKLGWDIIQPMLPPPWMPLEKLLHEADVVIGTEGVTLEALSCNRAAFVAGPWGWFGWATPETMPFLRRCSQTGRNGCKPYSDFEGLVNELSLYSKRMGEYGRALVEKDHNPETVAKTLLEYA